MSEVKLKGATYYGCTPDEIAHIIESYLDYSGITRDSEERGLDALAMFVPWWDEWVSDETSAEGGEFKRESDSKDKFIAEYPTIMAHNQIELGDAFNDDKQKLVDAVIEEMKRDIADNDWTAIDGLLYNCDPALLQGFLREEPNGTD